jgi:hypothetical protein
MSYLVTSPYVNELDIETPYIQTDTKEKHEYNRKKLGPQWHWYDLNFTYKMNNHGYRMNKELDEVDFDNYYAFFGCSFTTGIGLPIEETFAYKISKRADVDYVNAAIGGGSPSLVHLNLINMFTFAPKKPKAVIINWPDIYRQQYWYENILQFKGPSFSTLKDISYWNDTYKKTITEDSQMFNTFTLMHNTIKQICILSNCKLFEFSTFPNYDTFFLQYPDIKNIKTDNVDNIPKEEVYNIQHLNRRHARDLDKEFVSHTGISHQDLVTEAFFND